MGPPAAWRAGCRWPGAIATGGTAPGDQAAPGAGAYGPTDAASAGRNRHTRIHVEGTTDPRDPRSPGKTRRVISSMRMVDVVGESRLNLTGDPKVREIAIVQNGQGTGGSTE
ncbi:hypothetical protein FAGKG844_90022 [Frankia sp. AgKG'84/4]